MHCDNIRKEREGEKGAAVTACGLPGRAVCEFQENERLNPASDHVESQKSKVMKSTKFAAVVYNYIYNAATSGKAVQGIKSLELPCVPVKNYRDAETSNLAEAAREYGRRSYGRLFGRVSIKYTVTYGNGRKYSGYIQ